MATSNHSRITFSQYRLLKRTAFLTLLLILTSLPATTQPTSLARPTTNKETPYSTSTSPMLSILIVAFIILLFLVIFLFIYIRCYINDRFIVTLTVITPSWHEAHVKGLDAALLEMILTMVYSDVKGHKLGQDTVESMICLSEFEDDDILSCLPICSQVFHHDCIDIWLDSHVTCSICRNNLLTDPSSETVHADAIVIDQDEDLVNIVQITSSPHGAQLTNMCFMNKNSRIMEFFYKGWKEFGGVGQYVSWWIANASNVKH